MGSRTNPALAAGRTMPTRRNTELVMLLFAVLVVMAAQAIVDATVRGSVGLNVVYYGAGFAGLWLVAHLIVRRFARYADPLILPAVALLNGLGLVLIARLDFADTLDAQSSGEPLPAGDAPLQLAWTLVGLVLFTAVLVLIRDHRVLAKYGYTLGAGGLLLLALPAVLPSALSEVNGAKIWIRVAGFSIQPGEFAKIAVLIFFAAYLVAKRDVLSLAGRKVLGLELPRGRDLGPVLVVWVASLGVLVFEKDLGSSLLLFGIFVVMLYVATERVSWLAIGLLLFSGGAFVAYQLFSHVRVRVQIWLDPFAYRNEEGFQIVQSLLGFGTGGLFGKGWLNGPLTNNADIPVLWADFPFAAVGEQFGLLGSAVMLGLFGIVLLRIWRIAHLSRDMFGTYLCAGVFTMLLWQVFQNVGMTVGIMPVTGLPMPFISYGGSSLVTYFAMLGLVQSVHMRRMR